MQTTWLRPWLSSCSLAAPPHVDTSRLALSAFGRRCPSDVEVSVEFINWLRHGCTLATFFTCNYASPAPGKQIQMGGHSSQVRCCLSCAGCRCAFGGRLPQAAVFGNKKSVQDCGMGTGTMSHRSCMILSSSAYLHRQAKRLHCYTKMCTEVRIS